jgi:hypothetical protein
VQPKKRDLCRGEGIFKKCCNALMGNTQKNPLESTPWIKVPFWHFSGSISECDFRAVMTLS